MREFRPSDTEDGGRTYEIVKEVRAALAQLPTAMQATLWDLACTETIDQAAELQGVGLWEMALRRELAFRAFQAAFNTRAAEKLGILRDPYVPVRRYPRPPGKHYGDACAICRAPVQTRYVGGLKCARCNRPMPLQQVRRGKPKRFCSGRCQRTAYNQKTRR